MEYMAAPCGLELMLLSTLLLLFIYYNYNLYFAFVGWLSFCVAILLIDYIKQNIKEYEKREGIWTLRVTSFLFSIVFNAKVLSPSYRKFT